MRPDELKTLLERRPFEPFRMIISSGEHVDVRHPEMAIVARSYVAAAVRPRKGIAEHVAWYSLIHVVKVVPLGDLRRRRSRRKRTA